MLVEKLLKHLDVSGHHLRYRRCESVLLHKEHAAVCSIELLEAYCARSCRMRAGDAIAHEHEEVINQFRQDSKTISRSIRNLQVNQEPEEESPEMPSSSEDYDNSPKRLTPSPVVKKKNKMKGGGIRRFIRQTRFSLAF